MLINVYIWKNWTLARGSHTDLFWGGRFSRLIGAPPFKKLWTGTKQRGLFT